MESVERFGNLIEIKYTEKFLLERKRLTKSLYMQYNETNLVKVNLYLKKLNYYIGSRRDGFRYSVFSRICKISAINLSYELPWENNVEIVSDLFLQNNFPSKSDLWHINVSEYNW